MKNGDLSLWTQPRMVVILEGVLCDITTTTKGKIRKHTTYHFHWLPTPLKRAVYLKDQWPDTSLEVVTFLSQKVADDAAEFFDRINIPVSSVIYRPFIQWVVELTFQPDITTVYDSDIDRLQRYGQRGFAVIRGQDF